jgi:hypothetical protein
MLKQLKFEAQKVFLYTFDFYTVGKLWKWITKTSSRREYDYIAHNWSEYTLKTFWRILSASRKSRGISLWGSTIHTDNEKQLGDALSETKFEKLWLVLSSDVQLSNWSNYPHRLDNLFKGLGQSKSVVRNLKELKIEPHPNLKSKIELTLQKYNLKAVKLD